MHTITMMGSNFKRRTWGVPAVLAFVSGIGLSVYFSTGDILGGGAHSHIARTWPTHTSCLTG
jgi:hypothetical protein